MLIISLKSVENFLKKSGLKICIFLTSTAYSIVFIFQIYNPLFIKSFLNMFLVHNVNYFQ